MPVINRYNNYKRILIYFLISREAGQSVALKIGKPVQPVGLMKREGQPRAKAGTPEDDAQKAIVRFLRGLERFNVLMFFAVPNQLLRRKALRLIFWALGVQAGVPDLVLLFKGGRIVFVELKALGKNGKSAGLSDDQKKFHARLMEYCFDVVTITCANPMHGVHEVGNLLRGYGVKC